jgi:hypothetical protein
MILTSECPECSETAAKMGYEIELFCLCQTRARQASKAGVATSTLKPAPLRLKLEHVVILLILFFLLGFFVLSGYW